MHSTIYTANGFWARLYGWHRFARQHPRCMLFLPRCKAVHSIGLTRTLWVLFVDKTGQPLGTWQPLRPNQIRRNAAAYGVIEAAAPAPATSAITEWLVRAPQWEVGCFGQKCYEK